MGSGSSISVWNDPWLPTTRPRPANKNQHNLYPELTVESLIDSTSRTWNLEVIRALVDPQDAKLIESIPLGRTQRVDRDGWHFTKNGKFSVKSGYQVERIYPDRDRPPLLIGPTVDVLKAHCWKIRCPPKLKHFLWQLMTGCIAVRKNLQARGIKGDICCVRCGAVEESINHVFFECPPALQVWALSKIPSNPTIFPTNSLFTNMDYLFWRILPSMEDHQFAWILWYIWKARNNKVFSNLDMDPMDTLKLAETESILWAEAQIAIDQRMITSIIDPILPSIPGRWCFTDGSWKEGVSFSGQGWLSTLEGFDGLLGARNVRASLSPLHAEIEALLWAMECMRNLRQFQVTFATDCSQLVKMVSEPEEWPAFANYLEDITILKESFIRADIIYVPRTQNSKADSLARSARKQSSFVVHMDSAHPVWFTEST